MSEDEQLLNFLAGWEASDDANEDKITVKRIYIDINDGNLYDGLLFSQIMYWHGKDKTGKPRLRVMRDGHLWLAKSYEDWWEECRIIAATARKCIGRIEQRGFIICKLFKFDGAPQVHIRIDRLKIARCIKSICYPVSNPLDTTYQIDMTSGIRTLTETTTETTSERKDTEPATQVSQSREKKTTPANVMNPLKDAIVAAMGWEWASMTGTERGTVQKAAKLFAEAGATPEQVIGCKVECDKRGWTNYSPMALTKVLSDVRKQKVPPASQKRPAPVENEDVDLYERAFGVKLKALPTAAPLPPDDDIPF